ncbi:MAG TPA: VWA domain-containing protein [Thermosynergistes sp.]|nr:VWA domain-containing protein [Thermosynergistes sp.]
MGVRTSVRCVIAAVVVSVLFFASACNAQGDFKFRIVQVAPTYPELAAYIEVLDADGALISGLEPKDLVATLDGKPVTVSSFAPDDGGAAFVFLVDISRSLRASHIVQVRKVLSEWIDAMGPQDRAAIVTFGETVKLLSDYTDSKEDLKKIAESLEAQDQLTLLHQAIIYGLELGRRADPDLAARRSLVVISDGMDDSRGSATKDEVLRRLAEEPLPIYAVGFYVPPMNETKKRGLETLGEFARASGGEIFVAEEDDLADAFRKAMSRARATYKAVLDVSSFEADGQPHRISFVLQVDDRLYRESRDVRLVDLRLVPGMAPAPPASPEEVSAPQAEAPKLQPNGSAAKPASKKRSSLPSVPLLMAIAALIAVLALLFLISKRRSRSVEEGESHISTDPTQAQAPSSTTAKGVRLRLTVVKGAEASKDYDIEVAPAVTIGRLPRDNVVVIKGDAGVSGRHCEIFLEDGRLYVRDLNSTNGTFVNGIAIKKPQPLDDSDTLLLGRTELRVSLPKEVV